MASTASPRPPLRTWVSQPVRSSAAAASSRPMHDTLHCYVSCVNWSERIWEAHMATMQAGLRSDDMGERLLAAAEFACAAWIVIGHNVLRIFPNEVPILAVIALVSARLMRGGFGALGFWRPASWRLVALLAIGFVVAR